MFVGCCLATKSLKLDYTKWNGQRWQWVARGNIQQISYILQTEQHSPFGLMLLCLENVTIVCVCVCVAGKFQITHAKDS